MAKTQKQAVEFIKGMIGKQYDADGWFGYQCVDLANAYWKWLGYGFLKGEGAKDIPDPKWNDFKGKGTVYRNTPQFLAQGGDIAVLGSNFGGGYGHVMLVLDATLDSITVVEQNWLNGGWTQGDAQGGTGWEKATKRIHAYDPNMYFIRPNFAKNVITQKVASATNTVLQGLKGIVTSNKMRVLLVAGHGQGAYSNDSGAVGNGTTERDFIRANIVPRVAKQLSDAGHDVTLYGGSKMEYDMYQYTLYGQNIGNYKDYGMYWASKQKFDAVVEFHLDAAGASASGGHVIIGTGQTADKIDLGIQDVIKHYVGLIRSIDPRNNLLNVNVAKDCGVNYRLVELGFITSKKDMDNIKNNIANFTRDIANAICGNTVVKADVKKVEPKKESKPAPKPAPKPLIQVGSAPPKNLGWSKSPYLVARIKDSVGVTITRRSGDSRDNYKWSLSNEEYYDRNLDFYIYEVINGWCRVYSESNNGWIWHERLKVTKKL